MFSRVHKHINATTALAVCALVFAMTGGAFALSSNDGSVNKVVVAKSKAKTKSVRGPAGPRGATGSAGSTGAQGAQGPVGPQGPKGETGAAGTNGTSGAKGEPGPQGAQGKEGKQGEQGEPGPAGTTGFTKTLPSGETETGTWSIYEPQIELTEEHRIWVVPISFSIPLKAGLDGDVHYVKVGEQTQECPGTVEIPRAAPGQFCLYQGLLELPEELGVKDELTVPLIINQEKNVGTGTAGAIAYVLYKGAAPKEVQFLVSGSWAVTAP